MNVGLDLTGHAVGCRPGTDDVLYSVVVPVFNEEANVDEVVRRVCVVMQDVGETFELLFVDDGSTDSTLEKLREHCDTNEHVRVVKLSRNFGQEAAVQAAYLYARGLWVIQLDGDLQNPPEQIPKLLERRDDGFDIVYGVRTGRKDSVFRRGASGAMRWMMSHLLSIKLPEDISTFRLMRGSTAKLLAQFPERQKFLSALACWVGASYTCIAVGHQPRYRGKTKYNLTKLVNHTFDLIVGFSSRPLQLIGWLGFVVGLIGFGFATWAVISKLVWETRMGWSSIFAAVMAMGGMQLVALSLIGEYISRIFVQSQYRPIFVVSEFMGQVPPTAKHEPAHRVSDPETALLHEPVTGATAPCFQASQGVSATTQTTPEAP